jgi:hypothetical protein
MFGPSTAFGGPPPHSGEEFARLRLPPLQILPQCGGQALLALLVFAGHGDHMPLAG